METLLSSPAFQVTLAAVVGIGIVALGLAVVVYKFFIPRLGKALLSPALPAAPEGEAKVVVPTLINPAFCTACEAEHQRSLRNEANIEKLDGKVDSLRDCFDDGFRQISKEIGDMKTDIIKTLVANN
jgi:hypothetical protein